MICSKCKETLEKKDAILGGFVCPNCGKFNPRKAEKIMCLEDGSISVREVGKKLELLPRDSRFAERKNKELELNNRKRKRC